MTTEVEFMGQIYKKADASRLANDIISNIFSFYLENKGMRVLSDQASDTAFSIVVDKDTNDTIIYIRSIKTDTQIEQSAAYAKMVLSALDNFFGLDLSPLVTFNHEEIEIPLTIKYYYDGYIEPLKFDVNGHFDYIYDKNNKRQDKKIFIKNYRAIDYLFDNFGEIQSRIEKIKGKYMLLLQEKRQALKEEKKKTFRSEEESQKRKKEKMREKVYKDLDAQFNDVNVYLFTKMDNEADKEIKNLLEKIREDGKREGGVAEEYIKELNDYFIYKREKEYEIASEHTDDEIRNHFKDLDFSDGRINEIIKKAKKYRKEEEFIDIPETFFEEKETSAVSLPTETPDFTKFAEGIASNIVSQLAKMGPASLTQFVQSLNPDRKMELTKLFAQNPELLKDFKSSASQSLLLGLVSPNTYKEIIDIPRSSFGTKVKIDQTKPKIEDNIDRRIIRTNKISYKIAGKK